MKEGRKKGTSQPHGAPVRAVSGIDKMNLEKCFNTIRMSAVRNICVQ